MIDAAGGTAALLGISSGAVLALDAAAALPGVSAVVAFEPPLSEEHPQDHVDAHVADVEAHLAAGRNGAAVAAFLEDVGMPGPMLALMKLTPVLDGGKSPEAMRAASEKVAHSVPAARYRILPGQTHMVKAKVLSPVVAAFLSERDMQPTSCSLPAAPASTLEGDKHELASHVLRE